MALERLALSRSTLDRAAHLRSDPELLTRLAADPTTRVVSIHAGQTPVLEAAEGLVLPVSSPAERPEVSSAELRRLFLGVDQDEHGYVAVDLEDRPELPEGVRWAGLREVGTLLDDTGAGVLTAAVALLAWHAKNTHCANCGTVTEVTHSGWVRHCPNCGTEHYPRTDAAVIMAVVDPDDRILLGRQESWPPMRYSTLAGFVEPGESLEDAVRREVLEECGIAVGDVIYKGSQPWPFPASLMLGFRGEAISTKIMVDAVEITEAKWWTRAELVDDVQAGRLRLPPPVSIARRLIEDWVGAPVEGNTDVWR